MGEREREGGRDGGSVDGSEEREGRRDRIVFRAFHFFWFEFCGVFSLFFFFFFFFFFFYFPDRYNRWQVKVERGSLRACSLIWTARFIWILTATWVTAGRERASISRRSSALPRKRRRRR